MFLDQRYCILAETENTQRGVYYEDGRVDEAGKFR